MIQEPPDRIGNFQTVGLKERVRAIPWRAIKIAAFIVLLVGGYIAVSLYKAGSRRVHVVNGTPVAYDVRINGDVQHLPPSGRIVIPIAEGDVTIQRLDDPAPAPQTVRIASSFWSRPFLRHTFILNPDRAAVIVWEQAGYYSRAPASGEDKLWDQKYYAGELLHQFTGVEFEFQKLPEQLTLGKSDQASRRRVDLDTKWGAVALFFMLEGERGKAAALAQLRGYLALVPDDDDRLELLRRYAGDDELLRFVQPLLDRDPLMMEVHRAYQNAMMATKDRSEVIELYRRRLTERPEDARRLYLLARVIPDTDAESESLLKRAAESSDAPFQARRALVMRYMSTARFTDAVAEARRLRQINPQDAEYMSHEYEALWAAGRLEEALVVVDQLARQDDSNGQIVPIQAALLSELGRFPQAEEKVKSFVAGLAKNGWPLNAMQAWRSHYDRMLSYVRGDAGPLAASAKAVDDPIVDLDAAIAAGDLALISLAAGEPDDEDAGIDPNHWLLAAIAAHHLGDRQQAQQWLDQAATVFEDVRIDEYHSISAWLRGRETPSPDRVLAITTYTKSKLLLLVALAQRHPEIREPLFEAARPLNFNRLPPYLLLRDVLK